MPPPVILTLDDEPQVFNANTNAAIDSANTIRLDHYLMKTRFQIWLPLVLESS